MRGTREVGSFMGYSGTNGDWTRESERMPGRRVEAAANPGPGWIARGMPGGEGR